MLVSDTNANGDVVAWRYNVWKCPASMGSNHRRGVGGKLLLQRRRDSNANAICGIISQLQADNASKL